MTRLIIDNIHAYRMAVRDRTLAVAMPNPERYGTAADCVEEENRAYDGLLAAIEIAIAEASRLVPKPTPTLKPPTNTTPPPEPRLDVRDSKFALDPTIAALLATGAPPPIGD
jgi:hypothetical protein